MATDKSIDLPELDEIMAEGLSISEALAASAAFSNPAAILAATNRSCVDSMQKK